MSDILTSKAKRVLDLLNKPLQYEGMDRNPIPAESYLPTTAREAILERHARPKGAQNEQNFRNKGELERYRDNVFKQADKALKSYEQNIYGEDGLGQADRNSRGYREIAQEMEFVDEAFGEVLSPLEQIAKDELAEDRRLRDVVNSRQWSNEDRMRLEGQYNEAKMLLDNAQVDKKRGVVTAEHQGQPIELDSSWIDVTNAIQKATKSGKSEDLMKAADALMEIRVKTAEENVRRVNRVKLGLALGINVLSSENKRIPVVSDNKDNRYYVGSALVNAAKTGLDTANNQVQGGYSSHQYMEGKARVNEILEHFGANYETQDELKAKTA